MSDAFDASCCTVVNVAGQGFDVGAEVVVVRVPPEPLEELIVGGVLDWTGPLLAVVVGTGEELACELDIDGEDGEDGEAGDGSDAFVDELDVEVDVVGLTDWI